MAAGLLVAGVAAACLCPHDALAGEVCRFAGTTDYDGHVAVTTDVSATEGLTRVDVAVTFEATGMGWFGVHYLMEEISTWRAGEIQSVAVNSRYLLGEHIVRQQWDDFQRGPGGLQGRRVQAKTLDDFRLKHAGFAEHWDPVTFGRPWLRDYPSAGPERRPDLDLMGAPLPSGLRPPLAMAFYWVRFLPPGSQDVPVFLPGFKANRLAELPVMAAPWADGVLWQTQLRHPSLSESPASTATAWVSPDRHLLQLAFELHLWLGSGRGLIRQQGCEGAPVVPADPPR